MLKFPPFRRRRVDARNEMQDVLAELAEFLGQVGVHDWSKTFAALGESCGTEQVQGSLKDNARAVLRLYGGAGSFNDLVLGSSDHPERENNERLAKLRDQLYQLAQEVLSRS